MEYSWIVFRVFPPKIDYLTKAKRKQNQKTVYFTIYR